MPSSSSASEGDDMPVVAEASDEGSVSGIEDNDDNDDDDDYCDEDDGSEVAEDEQGDDERAVDLSDSATAADSSQEIKSEGQDEYLGSDSSTSGKSDTSLLADTRDMKDNGVSKSAVDDKAIGALSDKKPPCDVPRVYDEARNGNEAYLSNSDPSSNNGSSKKDSNGILNTEETKLMVIKEGEDLKLRVSSLPTCQIRPRSLSPGAEFEDQNKRPAIVCDFFARGWCIKGSSCRFLHLKDGTGKRDVPVASRKNELKVDAGLRQDMDTSKFSAFSEPLASSVTNSSSAKCHFPPERFLPREHEENLRWHQFPEEHRFSSVQRGSPSSGILQEASGSMSLPHHDLQRFSSSRDNRGLISSFGDLGRDNLGQTLCTDELSDHASPVVQGDFPKFGTPGRGWSATNSESWTSSVREDNRFFPSASIISSSIYRGSSDPSVYDRSMKEIASLKHQSQSIIYSHSSSIFSSSTPFSSLGTSPSRHTACPGGSSSYISSSFSGLDGGRGYHASRSDSLPRNSSSPLYSRSEADHLPLRGIPKDLSTSAGHKLHSISNDWEPSVPFRPSFFFDPANISSSGSQYDPLLDSIEPPGGGHKSFEPSSSSQGVGIQHMSYHQKNHDPGLTWSHGAEYNVDKHSLSFNQQSHGNVVEKYIHSHGLHMAADEITGTSVAGKTKVSMPREGKSKGPAHGIVVDVENAEINHDLNPRYQTDARHKIESKPGWDRDNDEMDLHLNPRQKQDVDAQSKESKALKLFRAGLVDFVKEMVKPYWREGNLSKDAHKAIVKKAVDKVIGTLQHNQVPNTTESINQYLSSSQSKIAKLVEGYVDKYAKSSAASG